MAGLFLHKLLALFYLPIHFFPELTMHGHLYLTRSQMLCLSSSYPVFTFVPVSVRMCGLDPTLLYLPQFLLLVTPPPPPPQHEGTLLMALGGLVLTECLCYPFLPLQDVLYPERVGTQCSITCVYTHHSHNYTPSQTTQAHTVSDHTSTHCLRSHKHTLSQITQAHHAHAHHAHAHTYTHEREIKKKKGKPSN